jgi:outer membrane protein OmpA-like peptidoglycan-associated protein
MDSVQAASRKAEVKPAKRASVKWIGAALGILMAAAAALFAIGVFKPDPAKVARAANTKAAAAIQALPANADAAATMAVLNQIVVPFAAGSNALPPEAEEVLKVAAQKISALPESTRIDVVSLAATMPKSEPEFRLILERSSAVISFMEKNGVAAGRLRAIGSSAPMPPGKQADAYTGPLITFRAESAK